MKGLRKTWLAMCLALVGVLALGVGFASADETISVKVVKKEERKTEKTFGFDLYGGGLGLRMKVDDNVWVSVNKDGDWGAHKLSAGVTYHIPRSFIVWKFYGGGGLSLDAASSDVSPFIVTGSEFVSILFTEYQHTWRDSGEGILRTGIRIRF